MGQVVVCCCPNNENGSNSEAYTSDYAPLIRDGSDTYNGNPGSSNQTDPGSGFFNGPGSEGGRSFSNAEGVMSNKFSNQDFMHTEDALSPEDNVLPEVNEEQQRLAEVLQEVINEIMDCSEGGSGTDGRTSQITQIMPLIQSTSDMSGNNGMTHDPSEMQARAVTYGKKLSKKNAKLCANIANSPTNNVGLVDVGGRASQLIGQMANEVLSDTDYMLASEVANRSQDAVIECEDLESQDQEECIVRFGSMSLTRR